MAAETSMEELVQAAIRRQEQASTTLSSSSSADNAQGAPTDAELDRILEKCTTTEPRQKYEDIILGLDEGDKSEAEGTPADAA